MKKVIVGLIIIVVLITVLAGSGGYWYYIQSKAVSQDLNQIVQILNDSNSKSTDLQNQITQAVISLSERAEYENALQQLASIIPQSQSFISQQQSKIDSIDQIINSELDGLKKQATEAVNVHTQALQESLELANFSQCVATNLNTQFQWMQELGKSWENTNETTAETTFVQLNRQTATKLRENVDTVPRIRDCFVGQYSDLFTIKFENSMRKDVSIYQNLASSMDKLANSVETLNRNTFLAAKDEITATLSQQSTFIGDTQLTIRNATDQISGDNASKMQVQSELVYRAKSDVEKKWWL